MKVPVQPLPRATEPHPYISRPDATVPMNPPEVIPELIRPTLLNRLIDSAPRPPTRRQFPISPEVRDNRHVLGAMALQDSQHCPP